MSNFTRTEARASTIDSMDKKMSSDGRTFEGWRFAVIDADGYYYAWLDESTSISASKSTIKSAIETYLQSLTKKVKRTSTYTEVTDKGLRETVG